MKTIPYTPLTGWQIAILRDLLPHMAAWLAAREGRAGK